MVKRLLLLAKSAPRILARPEPRDDLVRGSRKESTRNPVKRDGGQRRKNVAARKPQEPVTQETYSARRRMEQANDLPARKGKGLTQGRSRPHERGTCQATTRKRVPGRRRKAYSHRKQRVRRRQCRIRRELLEPAKQPKNQAEHTENEPLKDTGRPADGGRRV